MNVVEFRPKYRLYENWVIQHYMQVRHAPRFINTIVRQVLYLCDYKSAEERAF